MGVGKFLSNFFVKFQIRFSPIEHSTCHILGMVGPIDVKQKGNESTGWYADYGTFDIDLWPWIFKVKLYLGNWRPDCHETKGTGVDIMPWCETLMKWISWMLPWLGTFDLDRWPWVFMVKLHLWNGRPNCHGMKGTGFDRMPWCETQPLCDLEAEDKLLGTGVT